MEGNLIGTSEEETDETRLERTEEILERGMDYLPNHDEIREAKLRFWRERMERMRQSTYEKPLGDRDKAVVDTGSSSRRRGIGGV